MDINAVVTSIKSGNLDAFREIVETYQLPIVRYLFRVTGDIEIANDLAQDTFVDAYKGINKTDSSLKFKSWLFKIATNNARQYFRRQRILRFVPFGDHKMPAIPATTYKVIDIEKDLEIQKALSQVPFKFKICMILHLVDGFKYHEIAGTMGISEDAVRMRVARGKEIFKKVYAGGKD